MLDVREKVEQFLTHLAVHKNVAPSTQNQAFNALVFLYSKVDGSFSGCEREPLTQGA
ncbi:MAG: phage integrase N-terminal SAM-like domain-containing protein [Thiomicrorhabdus sp.]|nr:phage integrase N-terminal SAM-like domain-containing protein [Thiomicrorhabdus sp.]